MKYSINYFNTTEDLTPQEAIFCLCYFFGMDATTAYLRCFDTKMKRNSATPAASRLIRDERIISALKSLFFLFNRRDLEVNSKAVALLESVSKEWMSFFRFNEAKEEKEYKDEVIGDYLKSNECVAEKQLYRGEDATGHYKVEFYRHFCDSREEDGMDADTYNAAVKAALDGVEYSYRKAVIWNCDTGEVEQVVTSNDRERAKQ